jgi:two-component system, chemotaxis family, protein-glutamate methylesterase/glutaminase
MRVLVVDDSAVVRHTVSALLSQENDVTVEVAADPLIAMHKMNSRRPDVILLDIEMPRMDGVTFLRKIMAEDPIPVVICSAVSGPALTRSLTALELGAVDVVEKPKIGLRDFLYESGVVLVDALRAASRARVSRRPEPNRVEQRPLAPADASAHRPLRPGVDTVVAIGASTGGTDAIRDILVDMPADSPGILIVQHMPETFTSAFARRLNELSAIEVCEARDGDVVCRGRALIAPGNRHLRLQNVGRQYIVEIGDGPLVSRHRPSVNVLFSSVARAAGSEAIGVILTGMGDDGADGLREMRCVDAQTIAQDECSSVVFGMPRKAIERGAAAEVLPLNRIASAILHCASH